MITLRFCSRWFAHSWALALVIFACVLGPSVAAAATPAGTATQEDERKLALKVIETLVAAWNKNDTEAIAKLFLPDAILVTPKGEIIRSRPAISKRVVEERRERLKDTVLNYAIEDVSFPKGTTAVVKGKYRLNGAKILGVKNSFEGSFVVDERKQQGRWMISRTDIRRKKSD